MGTKKLEIVLHIKVPKLELPEIDVDPELTGRLAEAVKAVEKYFSQMREVTETDPDVIRELAGASAVVGRTMDVNAPILNPELFVVDSALLERMQNPPSEPDEKQRARERSKRDVRRKSRRGKYKWGGPLDE